MRESIACIESVNPQLNQILLQQISSDKRSMHTFLELLAQPMGANPPNLPPPSCFNCACCLDAHPYMGQVGLSFKPKPDCKVSSGNTNTSLNFCLSLDQMNKGKKVKSSLSVSKHNLEAAATVGSNLSRNSLERSPISQTNTPNKANIGVQVKHSFLRDMFLFGPSNLVKNSRFIVLHNIKIEGVEIDTTVCVLSFQTVKDQVEKRLKNRHKKQIENKPAYRGGKTRNTKSTDVSNASAVT